MHTNTTDAQISTRHQLKPAEWVIYSLLWQAAETGAACPSNIVLAAAASFSDPSSARCVMRSLDRRGVIEVHARNQNRRYVIICYSGKATAESAVGKRGGRVGKPRKYDTEAGYVNDEARAASDARQGSNALLAALAKLTAPADAVARPEPVWRRLPEPTHVYRDATS